MSVTAVVASLLAACSTGDSAATPSAATTSSTESVSVLPEQRVVLDADGRLVLPTTTASRLVLPARVSAELELAGAEAEIVVVPETNGCTLVVTLETEEVGFAFDSAVLSDAGRPAVELVAAELTGAPVVFVTGHSSSEGDPTYNIELSRRRADAVAIVLGPLLPSADFVIDGKGAAEPVAPNDTEDGRAKNRRVVIAGDVERKECASAGDQR